MSNAVLISQLLLWAGFVVLLVINFAVLRQVGVLFDRIAPAGALTMNSTLKTGQAAPIMHMTSLSGEAFEIGQPREEGFSTLLFFLSPDCPVCKTLLPVVKMMANQWKRLDVIYASAGEDMQEQESFIAANGLPRGRYIVSDELGMAYGVGKLPYAVLIGADGRLAAMGLVNTREHIESLFEAQRTGIASLQNYLSLAKDAKTENENLEEGERHVGTI